MPPSKRLWMHIRRPSCPGRKCRLGRWRECLISRASAGGASRFNLSTQGSTFCVTRAATQGGHPSRSAGSPASKRIASHFGQKIRSCVGGLRCGMLQKNLLTDGPSTFQSVMSMALDVLASCPASRAPDLCGCLRHSGTESKTTSQTSPLGRFSQKNL